MKKFISVFLLLALAFPTDASARRKQRARRPASTDSSVAMKTILEAEANRDLKGKAVINLTRHPNLNVSKAAILALGRIADPIAIEPLVELLKSSNKEIRISAAFAMGLIGGEHASKLLSQNTEMHKEAEVTAAMLVGFARSGGKAALEKLAKYINTSKEDPIVASACEGLGFIWSEDSAGWPVPAGLLEKLVELATLKTSVAVPAAFALARFKGKWETVTPLVVGEAIAKASDDQAKAYLVRAIGKQKGAVVVTVLTRELALTTNSLGVRIEASKGLGNQDYTEGIGNLLNAAFENSPTPLTVTLLDTIGSFDLAATALTPSLEKLMASEKSLWVKATALKNLARIQPVLTRQLANKIWSESKSTQMKAAAAYALARIGATEDLELLATWFADAEAAIVVEAIDGILAHKEEKMTDSLRAQLKRLLEQADVGITSQVSALVEQHRWRDFAPALSTIYRFFTSDDQVEAKVAILNALRTAGDSAHLEVIQLGLKDREKNVVTAAVKAFEAITGKNESKLIPLNSIYSQVIPSPEEIKAANGRKVSVSTSRGEIQMKLLPVAALTSTNFIKLVKQKFYDGKNFHRVVPNFVVQGGDPRGDGYGGPGYLIRDEVSSLPHKRGTVGIATAGKDTGGCQFFFNLAPNLHLNGRYTLFAEVTKGIEVAEKLEIGDKILTVRLM